MKIQFIYTLLICLITAGCDKNNEAALSKPTPEFLISASDYKKWEMIDPSVKLDINVPLPVIMPPCPSSEVKNGTGYFYHIYTNGTIDFQDGCGATSTDKALVKGTWAFNQDKTALTISLTGFAAQTFLIKELTASRLVLVINGQERTFAPTPFKS